MAVVIHASKRRERVCVYDLNVCPHPQPLRPELFRLNRFVRPALESSWSRSVAATDEDGAWTG